ncbi:MAG: hypothetical protein ABR551_14285 [Gemmatimonadales bacterium]
MRLIAEVVGRDPWTVRLNGTVHVAKPVSGQRIVWFHQVIEQGVPEASYAAVQALLRWAFPIRLSNWWRGDPVRQILRLPEAEQREILADFFAHQAGSIPARSRSSTTGTDSRP